MLADQQPSLAAFFHERLLVPSWRGTPHRPSCPRLLHRLSADANYLLIHSQSHGLPLGAGYGCCELLSLILEFLYLHHPCHHPPRTPHHLQTQEVRTHHCHHRQEYP